MNVSIDPVQNAAVQIGSLLAERRNGAEVETDIKAELDKLDDVEALGDVTTGGLHAVREITFAALGDTESSEHPLDARSKKMCVRVGEALAEGDDGAAEAALDSLADDTIDDRTARVAGILHYGAYLLLSFRMGPTQAA